MLDRAAIAPIVRGETPYERAVREYAQGTLREENLWRALAGLGFGVDEIEWHVDNPGQRMSQSFV